MDLKKKLSVVAWNVGFIETCIEDFLSEPESYRIVWMKHSYRDRFFADPFLFDQDSNYYYILAEEYVFWEGKGRIVKLTVDKKDKSLCKNERFLETDYHLSFPFQFDNYIVPEQSLSGKWIAYDTDHKQSVCFSESALIDAIIFEDCGSKWVLATKITDSKEDALRKLYRYRMVDNQVDSDSELLVKDSFLASRPAGEVFQIDDNLYRPAQNSTKNIYGESVTICKIVTNSLDGYSEIPILNVNSHNESRYNLGLHTFNTYDSCIIVDGFEMQFHPLQKIIYKIRQKGLFK